jgi:hypothetical protein
MGERCEGDEVRSREKEMPALFLLNPMKTLEAAKGNK